jgi:Ni/Fe-hydrogenase subunit HybB-like protein
VGLVILGIALSTLHQSTLGTLLTIAVHKMHPLWYSPIQNVTFFISCVAGGLGMVTFEAFLSYRFTKHPVRMDLLTGLFKAMAAVLAVYFVYRFAELAYRGALPLAFEPGFPAFMFWLENLLFLFVPLLVFIRKRTAIQPFTLFMVAFSVVLGLIMHRFNVSITAFQAMRDTGYFPSLTEVWVSTALVVGGFIAAALAVYLFPMHPHEKHEKHDDGMIRIPWKNGEKA